MRKVQPCSCAVAAGFRPATEIRKLKFAATKLPIKKAGQALRLARRKKDYCRGRCAANDISSSIRGFLALALAALAAGGDGGNVLVVGIRHDGSDHALAFFNL